MEGREGRGRRRKGREGAAEKGGREGEGGGREGAAGGREGERGRWGRARGDRKKFYLRVELIKCIDPKEGEALKRGRGGGG